jgi:hypothetical protein
MHVSMRYEGTNSSGVLADLKIAFNKIREIFSNTKFFAMYAKTFLFHHQRDLFKCHNIFYQLLKSVNVTDGKKSATFDFDKQLSASSGIFGNQDFLGETFRRSISISAHANYARETELSNVREFEALNKIHVLHSMKYFSWRRKYYFIRERVNPFCNVKMIL